MKLVQLLAKELKEWPDALGHAVGQAADGTLHCEMEPEGVEISRTLEQYTLCKYFISDIVTRAEWQAEREKMNKPKWIRHRGGLNPINDDVLVEVKLRSGDIQSAYDSDFIWRHVDCDYSVNIMQYRIMEETEYQEIEEVKVADVKLEMMQGDSWVTIGRVSSDFGASVFDGGPLPNGEEVKDTNLGTLTYKLDIDATEATQQIDSLVAKWGQIESPIKWRDEIIELEAYEEEFRREREKLIRKLESEGLKLIDHMAQVYGEQIIDMSDWRNWQAGDIVRVVANESSHSFDIGEEVVVSFIDDKDADLAVKAEYKDGRDFWWLAAKDAKFIRRP